MQGIYIGSRRPKTKKEVREAVLANPANVRLEATSWMGNEYDGPVSDAPDGTHSFVGPDPYIKRVFYGQVIVRNGRVTVK